MDEKEVLENIDNEGVSTPEVPETTPEDSNKESIDSIAELKESINEIKTLIDSNKPTPEVKQDLQEKKDELEERLKAKISYFKEGRNPKDWMEHDKELIKAAKEAIKEDLKKEQEDLEKQQEEETKKAEVEKENYTKQLTTFWESQLDDLEKRGAIPQLSKEIREKLAKGQSLSKEELEDPAVKTRASIYKVAYDNKYDSMKEAFYELYLPNANKDMPGKKAPVSGSRAGSFSGEDKDIPYNQLRRMSFDDIANK